MPERKGLRANTWRGRLPFSRGQWRVDGEQAPFNSTASSNVMLECPMDLVRYEHRWAQAAGAGMGSWCR